MATAIVAKSEMRENYNLQQGYGEIPGFVQNGFIHYALPCGTITQDEALAKKTADKLDKLIRGALSKAPSILGKPL